MMNKQEQRGSVGTEGAATYSSADIAEWNVEDNAFWESKGKGIANRNLWISIPNLLCGFAIWADVGHHHGADAEPRLSVQAGGDVHADRDFRTDGRDHAHSGIVLHPPLRRAQYHFSDTRRC